MIIFALNRGQLEGCDYFRALNESIFDPSTCVASMGSL